MMSGRLEALPVGYQEGVQDLDGSQKLIVLYV